MDIKMGRIKVCIRLIIDDVIIELDDIAFILPVDSWAARFRHIFGRKLFSDYDPHHLFIELYEDKATLTLENCQTHQQMQIMNVPENIKPYLKNCLYYTPFVHRDSPRRYPRVGKFNRISKSDSQLTQLENMHFLITHTEYELQTGIKYLYNGGDLCIGFIKKIDTV